MSNVCKKSNNSIFVFKAKPREVAMWMSVKHKEKKALDIWAREIASAGTGMAPGLSALVGGRPKPSPCLKLFSFLYPKSMLPATIQLDDQQIEYFWYEIFGFFLLLFPQNEKQDISFAQLVLLSLKIF